MIRLEKAVKKLGLSLNESTVSMVLGAIVVLLAGLIAYNFFRTHPGGLAPQISKVQEPAKNAGQNQGGQLGQAQSAVALPTVHTVQAGENLWAISEKYFRSGYNFVDIAKTNSLSNPNALEVGQKLTIPKVEVRLPLTVADAVAPVVTASKIEGSSYTVVKGDYLWQIAIRAYGDGYKWVEIAKANKLANPGLIHPGNVLTLPR